MLRLIASILITAIFFISGLQKANNFDGTVGMVGNTLGLNSVLFARVLTVLLIALEIIAPIIIVYSVFLGRARTTAFWLCMALIAVTVAAVYFMYWPPAEHNYMNILLHGALAGGLLCVASGF